MIQLKLLTKKAAAGAVAFFALMTVPAALNAQRTGLIVDRVAVQGNARITTESILGEGGIKAGDTITIRDVQRGMRRMWGTGAYKNIEPQLAEAGQPDHVVLTWKIEEQPQIGSVEITGLETIKESAVLDSAKLRAGPLRPGRVEEAKAFVRQMLAAKGYQVKKIETRLVPIPGSKTGDQRLIIDVEEGR